VIGGYRYGEPLDDELAALAGGSQLYVAKGERPLERNIRMLLAGRVELVLEVAPVFAARAAGMGVQEQVRELDRVGVPDPIYIACSAARASSPAYLKLLDEGIRALRASGELQRILDRYGMTDWQSPDAGKRR
jgi:polar amino acid transport system substrate-binding protein